MWNGISPTKVQFFVQFMKIKKLKKLKKAGS